jgi:crossover junction endodeoxyribonuclease RuvC
MRIIGIDPGTVTCGYGIVEIEKKRGASPIYITAGDIKMNKKAGLPERLNTLYSSLKSTIREYNPSSLCIEKIFYHKSIRSAMALGYARGIIMLLAAQNDLPLFEYNPTELKMALTGYGRAEKRQVQEMVKRILKICPSQGRLSQDSTDALALCICHINSSFQLK